MFNFKKLDEQNNEEKIYFYITLAPVICALLLSAIVLVFFRFLPNKMPLFYSLPWGDKQLATYQQFLIIPAVIILISILNMMFYLQLHSTQGFFKKILALSSVVCASILTVTFIKVVLIFV